MTLAWISLTLWSCVELRLKTFRDSQTRVFMKASKSCAFSKREETHETRRQTEENDDEAAVVFQPANSARPSQVEPTAHVSLILEASNYARIDAA